MRPEADAGRVKPLCLALAVLSLVLPAASVAQGPPPFRGGTTPIAGRAIAGALCAVELKELGPDAFKAKYPSAVACLEAHADQAAQILDKCTTASDPRACLRQALGFSGAAPAPAPPQGPRGRTLPLVPMVAAALCGAELKSIGVDAFKAKYKAHGACVRSKATQAAGIVKDAQTQCGSAERKGRCVLQAIARALGLPGRGAPK